MNTQTQTISKSSCITTFQLSPLARINGLLFGSPNFRRANGIVDARFDVLGAAASFVRQIFGAKVEVPVFLCERKGGKYSDKLPKIWLSEKVSNTKRDKGRVMVECYPSAPDRKGERALELGDRYLGEGNMLGFKKDSSSIECFKAAEILYLHALRRGNRIAASRLCEMYARDLCKGDYWKDNLEIQSRHGKRRVGCWRQGN